LVRLYLSKYCTDDRECLVSQWVLDIGGSEPLRRFGHRMHIQL